MEYVAEIQEYIEAIITTIRFVRGILSNTTLSIFIGLIVVARYFYTKRKNLEEKETIINAVLVFISTLGILPAIAVILLGLDSETCKSINIEQKVFIAGGIVLISTSVQGLIRNFKA